MGFDKQASVNSDRRRSVKKSLPRIRREERVSQVTATVTSKGQITVPASIRDEMGLAEGDRILFIRDADRFYIERVPGKSASERVFGKLSRSGVPALDVEKARAKARALRASRHLLDRGKPEGE